MTASLQDSHVYICKRSVLDALQLKTHFDSFKDEFFPWLCKIHRHRLRREKYGHGKHIVFYPWRFEEYSDFITVLNPFKGTTTIQALALQHSTTHLNGHQVHHHHTIPSLKPIKPSPVQASRTSTPRSIPTSPISSDDQEGEYASLKVGLILHRAANGFAARVNNIHSYMQANKHVCGFLQDFYPLFF
jgi:translation initiation factor eIF-2B subunit gamma